MRLHSFTDAGLGCFNAYLDSLRSDPTLPPPKEILDDPEFSALLVAEVELTDDKLLSRMDAARRLHSALATITRPERNKGLWAWLSLFFFDSVCPPDSKGHRKPGERPRYIPEVGNFRRYYRHLLLGPYWIFRIYERNPDVALALLWQAPNKPGDVVAQFAAYQELVTNAGVVEAVTRLYFDPVTKRERRGAQSKERGGARRLVDVLNQLDVTWDLYGMTAQEIEETLPKEFDRFRKAAA